MTTRTRYIVSVERETRKPLAIWLGAEELEEKAEETAAALWQAKENTKRPRDGVFIRVLDGNAANKILWENGAKVVEPAPLSKAEIAEILKELEGIINRLEEPDPPELEIEPRAGEE